jgi:hypothetical protein
MATQVQFRRGTTTQNNAFTGAIAELTVDTEAKTIRLHDGSTAGGGAIVATLAGTQTFTNKTHSSNSVWQGTAVGLAYGGTNANLTAVAGGVIYSGASALAISAAGTSGQVLTSAGASAPTWTAQSSLVVGTATVATTATNIAGGSAGNLIIQLDTNQTTFVAAGAAGTFLKSTGASTAPEFAAGQITIGSTATSFGDTSTSLAGVRSITMGNGSHGGATVGTITGSGPWTATLTGISSTTGIMVGQNITATDGTGSLFGGSPTSVLVASIVSGTSITVTVTGGTTPTAGTITSLTTFGFLQVPTGTTAQRPWVPANGMIRYNSTQSTFEGYSSSAWSSLGGVKSVDGYTYIQAETSAGNSNGDLDFYAEDSAGTAATQVGQWNRTNLKDYTGTLVGTQTTQNVFNTTATTVNAFGAATTLTLGYGSTASSTTNISTGAVGSGNTKIINIGTGSAAGSTTNINLGDADGGTVTVNKDLVVSGDLTVNGTTTTVNSTTLTVDDKNIELGSVGTPSDVTADGGGITLKGATDKTFNWVDATDSWTSSEHMNLLTGKAYYINATSVLNATTLGSGVTSSSLTTVGTIGTGVWQGTLVAGQYGGTGVDNTGKTITIGGNFTHTGAHTLGLTTSANTSITLPTTGTLATLAGSETLTNKTLTAPKIDLINDANGNQILGFSTTASAVDYLVIKNGIGAGVPPHFYADGSSANIGIHIQPKGTGLVTISDGADFNKGIRFRSVSSAASAVTLIDAVSTAGRVITLPDATDTLVGRATTDTLTNKTLTSPTLTTPALGVATATSINKVAFTAPATGSTLTIADGKTLTASNSLTFTGTDSTSFAFPGTSDTVVTLAATQTLTNKTLTSPTISGGTIDNAVIGGTTAAAGTFTTVTETSSIAYKENVEPITNALNKIMQLVGVTYNRKDGSKTNEAGLIAEDVIKVIPNIVTTKEEKAEAIAYTKLTAYLIEAIKEQQLQIEELKTKVGN